MIRTQNVQDVFLPPLLRKHTHTCQVSMLENMGDLLTGVGNSTISKEDSRQVEILPFSEC